MCNYDFTGWEPPAWTGWWREGLEFVRPQFENTEFEGGNGTDNKYTLYPPMPSGEYRVIDGELFKVEPGISPDFQLTEKTGRAILETLRKIEEKI
jgi:hypothetical protein